MLTEEELMQNDAFQKLRSLNLDPQSYIIMSSGIMFALGIRDLNDLDDLDLLVTPECWENVKGLGEVIHDDKWSCDHIYLFDNKIEIYNGWGPKEYDIKELLGRAYKVGNFNFMALQDLIAWKTLMGRDKDKVHLKMIEEFLKRNYN